MKTALITGASGGIGEQAARQLAALGYQVAIIGRNPQRTNQVARDLGALAYTADFADLRQVVTLAEQLLRDYPRIDLLAHNAGGLFPRQSPTVDGFEITFQVNHLAPFLLTQLLLPRLIACQTMVISTSSVAHHFAGLLSDPMNMDRPGRRSPHLAYCDSKLANILFTRQLQRLHGQQGITAVSYHPGMVASSFSSGSRSPLRWAYTPRMSRLLGMISPQQGADTLVWLAQGQPGVDWRPGDYHVRRAPARVSRKAQDEELAQELWQMSLRHCAPYLDGLAVNQ